MSHSISAGHFVNAPIVLLGLAQTLAWASSYYLIAVLADPIAREIGMASSTVFGAFSVALLASAIAGPFAGRLIDRLGGRPILVISNITFALGLGGLSRASDPVQVYAAWLVIGVAMGSGLYEAAFATMVKLYGKSARKAIVGVTLFAGLASTVGWPLSTYLDASFGWRNACLVWAALHLLAGIPLNALLPGTAEAPRPVPSSAIDATDGAELSASERSRAAALMSFAFAVTWFTSTAMAAHLPRLLQLAGATVALAVTAAALVGPAQIAGRVVEFTLLRRAHPLLSGRLASLAHPAGALCLAVFGATGASAFAVLHGLGNGILTIAIGTLPLAVFGARGYGQRQALLMVPARLAQAASPYLFGLTAHYWGLGALWLTSGLGLCACIAFLLLRVDARTRGKSCPGGGS